jgi:hypothetical protein
VNIDELLHLLGAPRVMAQTASEAASSAAAPEAGPMS